MTEAQLKELAEAVAEHKATGENLPLLDWIKRANVVRMVREGSAAPDTKTHGLPLTQTCGRGHKPTPAPKVLANQRPRLAV